MDVAHITYTFSREGERMVVCAIVHKYGANAVKQHTTEKGGLRLAKCMNELFPKPIFQKRSLY